MHTSIKHTNTQTYMNSTQREMTREREKVPRGRTRSFVIHVTIKCSDVDRKELGSFNYTTYFTYNTHRHTSTHTHKHIYTQTHIQYTHARSERERARERKREGASRSHPFVSEAERKELGSFNHSTYFTYNTHMHT